MKLVAKQKLRIAFYRIKIILIKINGNIKYAEFYSDY